MAAFVHYSAQLGEDGVAEARAVPLDEQIARSCEQHSEPTGAFLRMQEQAADFARSFKVGGEVQQLVAKGLAELGALLRQRGDQIAVERPVGTDCAEHLA